VTAAATSRLASARRFVRLFGADGPVRRVVAGSASARRKLSWRAGPNREFGYDLWEHAPGRAPEGRDLDVKYMIMMFAGLGDTMETRTPEWIAGMNELLMKLDGELREAGELVASERLLDPRHATTVRFRDGTPLPTDGPFAEVKESLAGYWMVEVSESRALEIASQVVAYTEYPMEVRRVMDMPPEL
jgi:hypothetical protein